MKKWITALFTLALALGLGAAATAAASSIAMDGKTYTFFSEHGTYEVDGKTFILEGQTMRVREPGRAERTFPLESSAGTEVIADAGMARADTQRGTAYDVTYDQEAVSAEAYSETTIVAEEGIDNEPGYLQYAPYGLVYDAQRDILTYDGQRVRIFEDGYPVGDGAYCTLEHCDMQGIVDVTVQRDLSVRRYNPDGSFDPSGQITGLSALSPAAFAARDLSAWTSPRRTSADASGEPMTADEKEAFYAPYRPFGITYDRAGDRLMYGGERVRSFLDVRQSNGEDFSSGRFKGTMTMFTEDDGTIDITILRDYAQPDSQGNGTITGIKVSEAP